MVNGKHARRDVQVRLGWRQIAVIAFGGWGRVAEIAQYPKAGAAARWKEMPAWMLDALMAAPDRPDWCTREMLIHGAEVEMRFLPSPTPARAPETLAAE